MPKNKKGVYIVSLIAEDGRKLYYVRQHCRLIEEGGQVLSEPLGVFSYDLLDAKKIYRSIWGRVDSFLL